MLIDPQTKWIAYSLSFSWLFRFRSDSDLETDRKRWVQSSHSSCFLSQPSRQLMQCKARFCRWCDPLWDRACRSSAPREHVSLSAVCRKRPCNIMGCWIWYLWYAWEPVAERIVNSRSRAGQGSTKACNIFAQKVMSIFDHSLWVSPISNPILSRKAYFGSEYWQKPCFC